MTPDSGTSIQLAFAPGCVGDFGELNSFGAFDQIVDERRAQLDVLQKQFPLNFEGVFEYLIVGDMLPSGAEVDGVGNVRVPDGFGSVGAMLDAAIAQAGDGAAVGAINVDLQDLVLIGADGPATSSCGRRFRLRARKMHKRRLRRWICIACRIHPSARGFERQPKQLTRFTAPKVWSRT